MIKTIHIQFNGDWLAQIFMMLMYLVESSEKCFSSWCSSLLATVSISGDSNKLFAIARPCRSLIAASTSSVQVVSICVDIFRHFKL